MIAWSKWTEWQMMNNARHVARDVMKPKKPLGKNKKSKRGPTKRSTKLLKKLNKWRTSKILLSTVFLGVDHSFSGEPVLFETMIFGGRYDGFQKRYTTFDYALSGHELIKRMIL